MKAPVPDYASVRKRILMLYFAAGLNTLMGFYVIAAGIGVAERGTVWLVALVFLAFAVLNYYMARVMTRRWDAAVRQRVGPADASRPPEQPLVASDAAPSEAVSDPTKK